MKKIKWLAGKLSTFFIKLFARPLKKKVQCKATHYPHHSAEFQIIARARLRELEDRITQKKCALYANGASTDELVAYENSATKERMRIRKEHNYWTP